MSLIKQLWLAIVLSMSIAFGGSLVVSVLSARHYLQQELRVKNNDNAVALALALTQLPKDPVTVDLQVAAQFDSGHYRFIRLVSPTGEAIAQRNFTGAIQGAPGWFMALFPIQAQPGQALVQDGWKQYGTVTLATHEQYAYQSLWEGALVLLGWFVVGGLGTGLAGSLLLRFITRPLHDVVRQAEGIAERRFVHIAEPRTPELRSVARAMNSMVERLVALFNEEAARLEALRQKVHLDPLTGLATRAHFMGEMREMLSGESAKVGGVLLVVRLVDLAQLNHRLGETRTDALIRQLGEHLRLASVPYPGHLTGRLKGGEFAVAWPDHTSPQEAAADVHGQLLATWVPLWSRDVPDLFHLGAIPYRNGQDVDEVLNRADAVLARAEAQGRNAWQAAEEADAPTLAALPPIRWRRLLRKAVSRGRLSLAFFPVVDSRRGVLLHQEAVVRLRADSDRLLSAGEFMPMAVHQELAPTIDLQVVRLALEHMRTMPGPLALNLAAETVADFGFRHEFMRLLQAHPEQAARLLLEVPENGVLRHFDAFRDLAAAVKPLGCRVGVEHFGQRLAEGHRLVDLALDYIKVHPSYLHDLARHPESQEFLRGICRMAHNLGITTIALGVQDEGDLALLAELGFDGVTGPGVRVAGGSAGSPG